MSSGRSIRQQTTPLAALTHAITLLAGARDANDVVDVIRATARAMMGCEGIAVIRREGDLCHYIEEDAIGSLWKGQKFPASICLSGWAMEEGRTVIVPDIAREDRVPHELYEKTFVKAVVMTPIRPRDPIGAIGAYWAAPYDPSPAEIEVLEALASATATAMENVRLIAALSEALEEAELVRDELRHRVKNAYMGAQGLVRLSLKGETSRDLVARIGALARVHTLIDDRLSGESFIDIGKLVEIEMEPYRTSAAGRYAANGPLIEIDGGRAVPLGLAINELATNALKYGALSVERGRVEISWSLEAGQVRFCWIESDGPVVVQPERAGDGTGLLARLVEKQLGGTKQRIFDPKGLRCTITFPLTQSSRVEAPYNTQSA